MKRILFLCDIDNTLMSSYKHRVDGDICIELLKDKPQGFTSERTLSLLRNIKACENITMIPLTTRSIAQYSRIDFGDGAPNSALCTNGTILLKGGERDKEWLSGSLKSVTPMKAEIDRMYALLNPSTDFIRVRIVDDMYLFVYCAEGVSPSETADKIQSKTSLNVQFAGKKIYLFPPAADKGYAAKRMAELTKPELIIAAGDSEIDLPMLKSADIAVIPNDIKMTSQVYKKAAICPDNKRFSEFVCETVLSLTAEHI